MCGSWGATNGVASAPGERPSVFTQCSKCETVFRVSAQVLRAARGQVRCGRCGEVFNALARLAEDAKEFTRGESPLEQESRADDILQSSEADAEPAPAAERVPEPRVAEPAQESNAAPPTPEQHAAPPALEPHAAPPPQESTEEPAAVHHEVVLDLSGDPPIDLEGEAASGAAVALDESEDDQVSDAMLEFTLPPTELDRIFVETTPNVVQLLASEANHSERSHIIHEERLTLFSLDGPEIAELELPPEEPSLEPPRPEAPLARDSVPRETAAREAASRDRVGPEPRAAATAAKSAPSAASQSVQPASSPANRIWNAERNPAEMPEIGALRRRLSYPAWISAAIVFGLLLGAQVVMTHSDWLSAHAPLLGAAESARSKLASYQLRQWGVTGDPGAKGALRVRAAIMNTASQPMPYPLLRVTLADRFGTRIGRREFEPAEYLGKPAAGLLAAGDHVDAVIDVQDPGQNAEAFEIDVCVRSADKALACAGDAAGAGAAAQPK